MDDDPEAGDVLFPGLELQAAIARIDIEAERLTEQFCRDATISLHGIGEHRPRLQERTLLSVKIAETVAGMWRQRPDEPEKNIIADAAALHRVTRTRVYDALAEIKKHWRWKYIRGYLTPEEQAKLKELLRQLPQIEMTERDQKSIDRQIAREQKRI